jgi:hypothetical protein
MKRFNQERDRLASRDMAAILKELTFRKSTERSVLATRRTSPAPRLLALTSC